MPGFGRRPEFDARSLDYPIRALLGPRRLPVSNIWACDRYLNQWQTPECGGFSWTHELIAEPVPVADVDEVFAHQIYRRAQQLDQWPGEDYEGTSVLACAKAIAEAGWMLEYRWAFGLADVLETLSYLGPVILGINWYDGMMNPRVVLQDGDTWQAGDCVIPVTGDVVGGHAILARGIDVARQAVLLHNSWGDSWGCGGTAWITWGELDRLLHEDGEACVPVIRVNAAEPEPEPVPVDPVEPIPPEPEPEVQGCAPKSLHRLLRRYSSSP